MSKQILLAGHTGSANRGCEAIVKSTADLLRANGIAPLLATQDPQWDAKLNTNESFDAVCTYRAANPKSPSYFVSRVLSRLTKQDAWRQNYLQKDVMRVAKRCDAILQVGGDTYCYGEAAAKGHMYGNRFAKKHGIRSVLWACSIGKEDLTDGIIADLKTYDLICPREPLTYALLEEIGIPADRLLQVSDPAFTLQKEAYPLPAAFQVKNTVGINVSPICLNNEQMMQAVLGLIRWILQTTDLSVALIPHVFSSEQTQDLAVLPKLYEAFCDEYADRICLFSDMALSARHLKFIISSCRFLLTARTHASIAGYSSAVPTFVFGYSAKSIGIAQDIFGDAYADYVANYASITEETDLIAVLERMMAKEDEICALLQEKTKTFQTRVERAIASLC